MRPIAERDGLTMLQLACQWNLAHAPCVRGADPDPGGRRRGARPIEDKRAELAALPRRGALSASDVAAIREIGDNTGCMALKGASPEHEGEERPDRWPLGGGLVRGRRAGGSIPSAIWRRRGRRGGR